MSGGVEKAIIVPPILSIDAGKSISFLYLTLGSEEVYRCLMGDENIEFAREYPVENLIEKLTKRIFEYVYPHQRIRHKVNFKTKTRSQLDKGDKNNGKS